MANFLSSFHIAFKKHFSSQYHNWVFEETLKPLFGTKDDGHVIGSAIKYELIDDLHKDMVRLLLSFADKHNITFTINHYEPVEISWFVGNEPKAFDIGQ